MIDTNIFMSGKNSNRKKTAPQTPQPAKQVNTGSKWTDLSVRFISALVLGLIEVVVFCCGKDAIFYEILAIQFIAVYEFMRVGRIPQQEKVLPFYFKVFPYLLAFLTSYSISGKYILDKYISKCTYLIKYNSIICFGIGSLLLVIFVIKLNPTNMSYAYNRLSWSIIASLILVVPVNFYARVPRVSIFWFLMAAFYIILNDTLAYFFGRMFGRTPLIALSPKKTVEGFVGALIAGIIISYFIPIAISKVPFLYCHDVKPFKFDVSCKIPKEFQTKKYVIAGMEFEIKPVQIHSSVFSLFSSLIAPFGGFLGSGLKRIYGIKDFGKCIPGHGGILDRVDCQFVMGIFAYIYIKNFINKDL